MEVREVPDEFDTDKGVKGDYAGTITDSAFVSNDQGRVELVLTVTDDDSGEKVENRYAVGQDWASFDGGLTVEHPTKVKVRDDSQLNTLVKAAMACGPDVEAMIRERSAANGLKGQKTAALWPGTDWYWEIVEKPYSFKDRETGDIQSGTSYKVYPTKYLGLKEVSTESSPSVDNAPIPAEVEAKLKVLAHAHSYVDWVDEVIALPGSVGDYVRGNMSAAISNESFYNQLKE
jgi:hypothetical protein